MFDREIMGRVAQAEISVFDAMMAEILGERNAEKCRVRNRRKADRKHPENKAERKKEKQNRMHRLYGLAYEDTKYGKTVYFWDKKEGQKKFPEYEAEIFRNLKERSAEKIARADYAVECGNRDDALAYHSDYLDMAIDHGERLEYLRKQIRKLDYERMIIANYDREIIYEQNRVNELMRIADTIMEGECY